MKRVLLTLGLGVCLSGCGKNSPTAPSTPTPATTRIVVISGGLTFGDVGVGATKDLVFSVSNTGNALLTVTGITAPDGYTPNWTSGTLAAGAMQSVTVRFAPTAEQSYNGTLTISGDQTGGTSTISVSGIGTRPPRRGIVTDPAGDARPFPGIPAGAILPDLVGATIDISGGMFSITVSFASGTFSPSSGSCIVHLDTDENPTTGGQSDPADAFRVGFDYTVYFIDERSRARIDRFGQSVPKGFADVTFLSADQARITFPMSLLDNDDGRLAFKLWAFGRTSAGDSGAVDIMPNSGVSAGVTR